MALWGPFLESLMMRKYKTIRTMGTCTKVIMDKGSLRNFPRLAFVVILLAQPALLMAQQGSLSSHIPGEPAPAVLAELSPVVETASNATASATGTIRPVSPGAIAPVVLVTIPAPTQRPDVHPFWDRQNRTLFVLNGAMAGTDFYTTRRNLEKNGTELNPVARIFTGSTPGLAANFAMETAGVIGVSYLLHKTGHHKLERVTSYVNLGASAFAVSYGLAHH